MKRSFIRWKPFKDLTGQSFGRLRVLAFKGLTKKSHRSQFICQCDCGQIVIRLGNSLLCGVEDQSCGHARTAKLIARNRQSRGIARGPRSRQLKLNTLWEEQRSS